MAKTLSTILEIGSLAALAVVTGGAAIGVAGGFSVGASISGAVSGIASALGVSSGLVAGVALAGVGSLLNEISGPKTPKPEQTETALKQPITPRQSGYGEGRSYMDFALYVTAPNGRTIDVGSFHTGRVDSITRYYLGDLQVTLLPNGFVKTGVDGQFGDDSDIVTIGTRLGLPTETAFAEVIAEIPDQWTADHRGDGQVTGFVITRPVKTKNYQRIFPTGGPNNMPLSLVMKRQLCFDWRDPAQNVADPGTWKYTENAILHTAHYLLVRDNKDWATHFAPTLASWTEAANVCDEAVPLTGVQTVLVEKADKGSGHITVTTTAGLSNGMTIVVSSTGDTSLTETRTVTGIAGNVLALSSALGNDHPQGSQVTWSSTAGSPATEPRYRSVVAHKHTDPHKGVIANLLACCDGWVAARSDGALVAYAGRLYPPTVTLGPDEIVSYSIQDGVNEEDAVNQIAVSYVSANHDYNVVDTDAWEDDDDITARGKVLADQLANQVATHSQARRLAKRVMAQKMAGKRGTCTTNSAGRAMLGQRYVRLQLIDAGVTFLDATVEVVQDPAPKRLMQTGGVSFSWRLVDPNIDEWNPATEEGQPAPVGNRVAAAPLDTPTITSATAVYAASTDGGTGVRIQIVAAGLNRQDVTWYARWRVVGAASWDETQYPDTDPGASVTLTTVFVPAQSSIEVEVAYQAGDGRLSDWSDPTPVSTATDATPPDAASTITLVSWTDSINLITDQIARASSYRWRFYAPDGTTLKATVVTSTRSVSYSAARAALDGVLRAYIVEVAGVNTAGPGTPVRTGTISNAAPPALTGFSMTGGASEATANFDASPDADVAGYVVYSATTSGFDPYTAGTPFYSLGPPAYLQNLAAGTFYAKAAAFDAWSNDPRFLNFSSESSYAITTGGGGVGGGGGGGGGGYCPTLDTPILMANNTRDGPGATKPAGDLKVGDYVWTQHEVTMEWGAFPVSYAAVNEDTIYSADIGSPVLRASGSHLIWLSGWVRLDAIGSPSGREKVAVLTVDDAHTYVSAGVLSHNKQREPITD